MLSVSGLGKRFGKRWIFRRVEFCLGLGQVLVVTGPNGSGKSTLLRILAGLEPPSDGTVDGASEVGYVSPELALYSQLTGSEHIELASRLRRGSGRCDPVGALERVGLGESRDLRVGAYSTGMKARLRLALAVCHRPGVLLLDEASASLDEAGKSLVESAIAEQRKSGVVVLATNDPEERRFGDFELRLGF
jgi:ABC-type multidrug transport system ATPase subunit